MSGKTNTDRRSERRQETRREIVDAAWEMVREDGLAGLSMRDLGRRVGMRAQSLYSYFASKQEIYDAMFHQGYAAFLGWIDDTTTTDDPTAVAKRTAHRFVDFCTSDPARYQLLFQRTVPGFVPSPESWAVALEAYERTRRILAGVGLHDQASLDLWTALMTGLADQQISNDPGGDRWRLLVDRAVDMLLTDARRQTSNPTTIESDRP